MIESSGLLLYRKTKGGEIEVLIGHMGGPYWAGKQQHAWSVPKGLHGRGEHKAIAVAVREFEEEMGSPPPDGPTIDLGSVRSGDKTITVFARQGDFDPETAVSNTFSLEWPPGSGRIQEFPEIDEVAWRPVDEARSMLTKTQAPFLDRLLERLGGA